MAVTYSASTKTSMITAVLNAIDGGTGAGKLIIRDSSNATLVSISFGSTPGTKPSGSVSGATLTFAGAMSATATGTGTANNAIITQSDGTTSIVTGLTVGTSGTDIVLGSTSIASGQIVSVSAGSLTTQ